MQFFYKNVSKNKTRFNSGFSTSCRNNNKRKKFFAIPFIIEAKSFINEGKAKINKSNNASLIF